MTTKITADNIEPGTITEQSISNSVILGGPRISSIDYPGDDTAALPAGGQTVSIIGSGFQIGCAVYIDSSAVGVVSFISSTEIQFIAPAKNTGLYPLYIVNSDGGTAIGVPGMVYSGTPTWTTASGSLGTNYETDSFSVNLSATGDGALTYALTSGSSLPPGLTLSSNGVLSGTVPATNSNTTYTFNIDVIDSENQSTTRQFSVTHQIDVVTWSSPANDSSYTWDLNVQNSVSLSATSAANKTISYSVQSGSLPSNVTISGSNITGTPNVVQSSTAAVIRATAASTNRYADRTLNFTVAVPVAPWTLVSSPSLLSTTNNITLTNTNQLPNEYSDVQISPDGTKLGVYYESDYSLQMYDLSSANTLGSLPAAYNSANIGNRVTGFYWKPDGTKLLAIWWNLGRMYTYNTSAWYPSTISPTSIYTGGWTTRFSTGITGLYVSDDGTKGFIAGDNKIALYNFGTAWLANTISYSTEFTISDASSVRKVFFRSNGTRMFVSVITSGVTQIRQYNLSSAWDMSTASLASTFITTDYSNAGQVGLSFTSNGENMYTGAYATNTAVRRWNTNA